MQSKKLSPARRFWLLLKPDQQEIRNLYLYAIIIGLLNLVLPLGIQSIIGLIQGGAISTSWYVLILFVAIAITISGVMQVNQLRITENLQQKIFTRAAFEFTYRIPRIKWELMFRRFAPELMNRFFDVISVQKGMTKILVDVTSASIQVFFGLLLLCFYHPFFIIFSLLLVVLIYVIFQVTMRRGLRTSLEESRNKYAIVYWLEEIARSNTTFKLNGKSNLTMDRTNDHVESYIDSREQHFKILKTQYSLMIVFKVIVTIGLLLIGGLLVIDQKMNIGQFVASEIVILLIVNSVEKLIVNFENIYDVLTSLEKLGQVTDMELEDWNGLSLTESEEGMNIKLSNISFKYPQEQKFALTDVSFSIEAGQRVLITGSNDSGKSTLLNLVAGMMTPTDGKIIIQNTPVGNFNFDELRSKIGGYLRDETLFEGTLLENITLARPGIEFSQVKWALESLGVQNLVNNLPKGYDTKILPQGKQFSKSTVSKILLARAIVNHPRLLILENSFSIFSPEDRELILNFLLDRKHSWTILMSSSSPINRTDLIDQTIELYNGEIISKK